MYARVRVVVVSDDGALAGALVRSGSGDSAVVALTDQTGGDTYHARVSVEQPQLG